jgi:hypothetical protein
MVRHASSISSGTAVLSGGANTSFAVVRSTM